MEKYQCYLPWMRYNASNNFNQDIKACQINGSHSYPDIIKDWTKSFEQATGCIHLPKCQRAMYKAQLQPSSYLGHSTNGSVLKIQFDSPSVMVIKDDEGYDFQSCLGEVGGTLGLFLGLSFLSIIDGIEFCLKNWICQRPL